MHAPVLKSGVDIFFDAASPEARVKIEAAITTGTLNGRLLAIERNGGDLADTHPYVVRTDFLSEFGIADNLVRSGLTTRNQMTSREIVAVTRQIRPGRLATASASPV